MRKRVVIENVDSQPVTQSKQKGKDMKSDCKPNLFRMFVTYSKDNEQMLENDGRASLLQ